MIGKFVDLRNISGTGGTGLDGADGKSAYEIAVDYGFEGTEQEWIESLGGSAVVGYTEIDWINGRPETVRKYASQGGELLSTVTILWVDNKPATVTTITGSTTSTTTLYWANGVPINVTKD